MKGINNPTQSTCSALILAGGRGTRMKTKKSKLLLCLNGKPIINYIVSTLMKLPLSEIVLTLGYQAEEIQQTVSKIADEHVRFVTGHRFLPGTGNAVKIGCRGFSSKTDNLLVVNGDDSAFYQDTTLEKLITEHPNRCITMLLVRVEKDVQQNRIVQDESGTFRVVSYKELIENQLAYNLVSTGAFVFNFAWLMEQIDKIPDLENAEEVSIFRFVQLAQEQGLPVHAALLENRYEWMSINSLDELKAANQLMRAGQLNRPDNQYHWNNNFRVS